MARSISKALSRKLVNLTELEMEEFAQELRAQRTKALLAARLIREQRVEFTLAPIKSVAELEAATNHLGFPPLTDQQKELLDKMFFKATRPRGRPKSPYGSLEEYEWDK